MDGDRLRELLVKMNAETDKCHAAQCMVDARMKELEAAVHLKDWTSVERARHACVMAFEHLIDAKIGAARYLMHEIDKS